MFEFRAFLIVLFKYNKPEYCLAEFWCDDLQYWKWDKNNINNYYSLDYAVLAARRESRRLKIPIIHTILSDKEYHELIDLGWKFDWRQYWRAYFRMVNKYND